MTNVLMDSITAKVAADLAEIAERKVHRAVGALEKQIREGGDRKLDLVVRVRFDNPSLDDAFVISTTASFERKEKEVEELIPHTISNTDPLPGMEDS